MNFKIPILNKDKEQVKVGDVYLLTYNVRRDVLGIQLGGDLQKRVIEWIVERTKNFEVENSWYNEAGQLVLQCKVLKNPLPFLVVFGIVAAGISTLALVFGMTLSKVEKVITVPAAQAISYGFMILAAVFAYKTLKK